MRFSFSKLLLSMLLVGSFVLLGYGQDKPIEGSPFQRLEVLSQKLSTMRRSLNSAASGLKEEGKDEKSKGKEEKGKTDTPLARLQGLEKEAGRLLSDVATVKGKVDRG